jgi:hypothetical protein
MPFAGLCMDVEMLITREIMAALTKTFAIAHLGRAFDDLGCRFSASNAKVWPEDAEDSEHVILALSRPLPVGLPAGSVLVVAYVPASDTGRETLDDIAVCHYELQARLALPVA